MKCRIPQYAHDKLIDKAWMENEYCTLRKSMKEISKSIGVSTNTFLKYFRYHNFELRPRFPLSNGELEIAQFLKSLNIEFEIKNSSKICYEEYDFYIKSHNFFIDFIEIEKHYKYYSDRTHKNLSKVREAEQMGFDILQITDLDWKYNRKSIEHIIEIKLEKHEFYDPDWDTASILLTSKNKTIDDFIIHNSIYDIEPSDIYAVLLDDASDDERSEIMSIVAFSNIEDNTWRITGFCTVYGLELYDYSNLIDFFEEKMNPEFIYMKAPNGKLGFNDFIECGFKCVEIGEPELLWNNGSELIDSDALHQKVLDVDNTISRQDSDEIIRIGATLGYKEFWDAGFKILRKNCIRENNGS